MSSKEKKWDIEDFIKKEIKKQLNESIVEKEIKKFFREAENINYEEYLDYIKSLNIPNIDNDTLSFILKNILEDKNKVIEKIKKLTKEQKEKILLLTPEIIRELTFIYSYLLKEKNE